MPRLSWVDVAVALTLLASFMALLWVAGIFEPETAVQIVK